MDEDERKLLLGTCNWADHNFMSVGALTLGNGDNAKATVCSKCLLSIAVVHWKVL